MAGSGNELAWETAIKTLAKALTSKTFAITAELPFRGHVSPKELSRQVRELSPYVDGIQTSWNLEFRGHVSPAAAAALLLNEEVDPVVSLNCRDRNRLALNSELVGLKALGVTSLLLNRGTLLLNPAAMEGTPVFDTNCHELIAMALATDEAQAGEPGTEFMIGTRVEVFKPKPDWKGKMLKARSKAGARFLQIEPCLSLPMLRRYMQHLVQLRLTWDFAVIVTLAPLPGMQAVRWQLESSRGTIIPKTIVKKLAGATDPEQAGIELCAQQIREIADIPGISGVNLLTLGNPGAVIAAIEASGLRGFNTNQ